MKNQHQNTIYGDSIAESHVSTKKQQNIERAKTKRPTKLCMLDFFIILSVERWELVGVGFFLLSLAWFVLESNLTIWLHTIVAQCIKFHAAIYRGDPTE